MADEEQLAILKQGVAAWNAWQEAHPDVVPDLSRAHLFGADLTGAVLTGADLTEADLQGANLAGAILNTAGLGGANLQGADLSGAHLRQAHLPKADLERANLRQADLRRAHLPRVDLEGAYLWGADLEGADLERANLWMAELRGADLTGAHLHRAYLLMADLSYANLEGGDLQGADLRDANLQEANLVEANLQGADLRRSDLYGADLRQSDLQGAYLNKANFQGANLAGANLSTANLYEADLQGANLVKANLQGANLVGCRVYGTSVWNVQLDDKTKQENLIITDRDEPTVRVDNLKVAQFIYLLLNNREIRDVIDTVSKKVVLILGRFTQERKPILEAIQQKLRHQGYVPVLFDFDKPNSQTFIETVSTLAHMARFVIADVTRAKIVLQELERIVTNLKVPVQPLLSGGSRSEPVTLGDLRLNHRSVLDTYRYKNLNSLLEAFDEHVIAPAEAKAKEFDERLAALLKS